MLFQNWNLTDKKKFIDILLIKFIKNGIKKMELKVELGKIKFRMKLTKVELRVKK